jgi:hypothetical protein
MAPALSLKKKAHPLQWKDIGGDEIRQRYSSRFCSLISINDAWYEGVIMCRWKRPSYMKRNKLTLCQIKGCINYGENRAEFELTSFRGLCVRYENCKCLVETVDRFSTGQASRGKTNFKLL